MADPERPAFVWSPHYEMDIGRHVFPTAKFRLVKERLVATGLVSEEEVLHAPKATDEELLAVLEPEYLRDLRGYRHTERTRRAELPITAEIVEAMCHTAGGTLLCAREALRRGLACHLGGGYHHAYPDHAEGFCYINDIAIAVAVLLREGLVGRIAIVDTDVHQGNGTAFTFRDDPRVYTFSLHEEDLYPKEKERGDLDIGLPREPGAAVYLRELDRGLDAAIGAFRPDLVVHAAGVDCFEDDQLGHLGLSRTDLRERDRRVALRCLSGGIPLVTVVSGGYARRLDDTVSLHAQTIEVALELLSDRTLSLNA